MLTLRIIPRLLFLWLIIVFCFAISTQPLIASDLSWSRVSIPADGAGGHWVLAEGSDLSSLTQAADGTLYCAANPTATPYRLFKSCDNGLAWSYCGRVEENITAIATPSDNPSVVYYATSSHVWRSVDAGNSFEQIAESPGEAGNGGLAITSLAAASMGDEGYLAVGISEQGQGHSGGVYILNESLTGGWQKAGSGDYDFYALAFSRGSNNCLQLLALGSDGQDTVLCHCLGGGDQPAAASETRLSGLVPLSAGITFPVSAVSSSSEDNLSAYCYLNTGSGQGGVYRLNISLKSGPAGFINLNAGGQPSLDIGSLAVVENNAGTRLLAGSAISNLVYSSQDGGATWSTARKPPSGDSVTAILSASAKTGGGLFYLCTSGTESAFSVSSDQGLSWDQRALIDSRITAIIDLAVSPRYNADSTLFMLSTNIRNSLWRSADGGTNWLRIYCTSPSERLNQALLSPDFSQNSQVYLAGVRGDHPVIWFSEDSGQNFTCLESMDSQTAGPVNIDCWAIAPGDVLYVGSFDGDHSRIYQTAPGALNYINYGNAGNAVLDQVVISPGFTGDQTLLVSNIQGGVLISRNKGLVFEPLPLETGRTALTGSVSLAFDPDYTHNGTLYAATSGEAGETGQGLFRFVIDQSYAWQKIDQRLPEGAGVIALAASDQGVLYGVNSLVTAGSAGPAAGGVERCLAPTNTDPLFEILCGGLDEGIHLGRLWVQDNRLWTLDLTHRKLLTCRDTLATPITLISPPDQATGLREDNLVLDWDSAPGAEEYQWQIAADPDFWNILKQGHSAGSPLSLTGLEKDAHYYWRVRALTSTISGGWSTIHYFTTRATAGDELKAPVISQPKPGSLTTLRPVFEWSVCSGADSYELRVSQYDNFSQPVIDKCGQAACNTNVWACDIDLAYSTAYYWQVRAAAGSVFSDWVSGLFTTQAAPVPEPELPAPKPASPTSSTSAPIQPAFRWNTVEKAESYQLVVSQSDNFTPLVIDHLCYANSWQCNQNLAYQTAYYWKVRALKGETHSAWSTVYVFTTRTKPSGGSSSGGSSSSGSKTTPPPSPTLTPTPTPVVASTIPAATVPAVAASPAAPTPSPLATVTPAPSQLSTPDSPSGRLAAVISTLSSASPATVAEADSARLSPSSETSYISDAGSSRPFWVLVGVLLAGVIALAVILIRKRAKGL
jgi:hypothetical protein